MFRVRSDKMESGSEGQGACHSQHDLQFGLACALHMICPSFVFLKYAGISKGPRGLGSRPIIASLSAESAAVSRDGIALRG